MATQSPPVSPQTTATYRPASTGGFGEFFRYHGWLAPGVRMFRSVGFKAKAAWISAAFLLPLAMALGLLVMAAQEQVATAQSERLGVAVARPVFKLVQAAQDRRRAAFANDAELATLQDKTRAAFADVEASLKSAGQGMGLESAMAPVRQRHEALMRAPTAADADATFTAHSDFVEDLMTLLREVADRSQLALDPELQTFHMMNMAMLRGPLQVENTAKMHGMGLTVLKAAAAGQPMAAQRHEWLDQWTALWAFIDRDVENSYEEGIESDPEVAKSFDMKGVDEANDAFKTATAKQLLSGTASGDPAAFDQLGKVALQKQWALNLQVLERLDSQLQARIDRLQWHLYEQLGISALFVALAGYLLLAFYKVMMLSLIHISEPTRPY